jgi:ubiquinone/menaquinone biosynthesis C-methylase UbiE
MSWWEDRVLPHVVDLMLGSGAVERERRETCAGLRGHVVEIGFGSGRNVPHYPAAVTQVSAVEPNDVAWGMAASRLERSSQQIVRVGLDGQRLPLDDAVADAVLMTFVLCTIPDVRAATAEVRRVLRPGGEVHFLEHGRSPDPGVAAWQRRLEPMQRRLGGGCHLTREPVSLLTDAGMTIERDDRGYLPGPRIGRPATYLYRGLARR